MLRYGLRAAVVLVTVVMIGRCSTPPEISVPRVPAPTDWTLIPGPVRESIRAAIGRCNRQPNDPATYEHLAHVYHGNEQTELATAAYMAALDLGSKDARTHYLLGLIHLRHGRSVAAIDLLGQAAALDPSYGPAHFNMGNAMLDAARPAEAIDAFERSIKLDATEPSFQAGLGRALRHAGRMGEAAVSLRRALELDPDSSEVQQLLGLTLLSLEQEDEARRHLGRITRQTGSVVSDPWLLEVQRLAATPSILLDRARIYLDQGRTGTALEQLAIAAASYPDNAAVFRMLGQVHWRAQRIQRAVTALVRATDLEPFEPEAHAALAVILSRHGSIDDAEHEADLALAADPGHVRAGVVKAGIAVRRGKPDEAIAIIRPILDQRDDLVLAHVTYGEALLEQLRLEPAAAAFARAVELEPASEYPRRRLGLTYLRLDRREDARRELLIAADLDPGNSETRLALATLGMTPGDHP